MYINSTNPEDARLVIDFEAVHVLYKTFIEVNNNPEKEMYIVQGNGGFFEAIEDDLYLDVINCWCKECPQVVCLIREEEVLAINTLKIATIRPNCVVLHNGSEFELAPGEMAKILECKIKAHQAVQSGHWSDDDLKTEELRPYKALPPAKDPDIESTRTLFTKLFQTPNIDHFEP
jgi:hypothetical protein